MSLPYDRMTYLKEYIISLISFSMMAIPFWLCHSFLSQRGEQKENRDNGLILCHTIVLWFLFVLLVTEGCSAIHALTGRVLWIFYLIVDSTGIFLFRKDIRPVLRSLADKIGNLHLPNRKEAVKTALSVLCGSLLLVNLYCALTTVPYNYDSLTYHLARIMYWIEHRSVSFYDTWNIRQLVTPPLAEYVQTHIFLLSGLDRFANMLQFLSGCGCCLLGYDLARRLGCKKTAALLVPVLYLTSEIFAAESVTTQVDLVGALLLGVVIIYATCVMEKNELKPDRETGMVFILWGLACGELYLIKSSLCICAAVVIMGVLIRRIRKRDKIRQLLMLALMSAIPAILLILPHFVRNARYSGSVLASGYVSHIAVGSIRPNLLIVNAIKNLSLLLVYPNSTDLIRRIVENTAKLLRVEINDPAITFGNSQFRVVRYLSMDVAGMPVIATLAGCMLFVYLIHVIRRRSGHPMIGILFLQMIVLMFAVRWQPWGSRLLFPAWIWAVPASVCLMEHFFCDSRIGEGRDSKKRKCMSEMILLACSLLALSIGGVQYPENLKQTGGLATTFCGYYRGQGAVPGRAQQLRDAILNEKPANVGLYTTGNTCQYPILRTLIDHKIPVESVGLYAPDEIRGMADKTDIDGQEFNPGYQPDLIAVIDVDMRPAKKEICECNGASYSLLWIEETEGTYSLWKRTAADH